MDLTIIKEMQSLTPVEQRQKKSHINSDDLPSAAIDFQSTHSTRITVLNDYFFRNHNIYISKHNRFADFPTHTHQFFEINYMLSGHVKEIVNGQEILLSEGDALLLDVGTAHSIKAPGENDILINILFRDQNISIDLLHQIQSAKSVLYDFLLNRVNQPNNKPKYLLFSARDNQEIPRTIDQLIEEYYKQDDFSDTVIQSELNILIARLVRNHHVTASQASHGQKIAIEMLKDIRNDYQDLSLEKLATAYSYNKNYLGNLFHREVGKTFSQVLTEERLIRARELIQSTDQPVSAICAQVGISNKSFFYHKYTDKFGHTPKEDRKLTSQNHTSLINTAALF